MESSILHGERQSGANESQQECNAVWLILGSLSVWFYWEKWDDDRWISALTASMEGRVIVGERLRVFSVLRHVIRGQSITAFIWMLKHTDSGATQAGSVLMGVAGVTPVSVLFQCWSCHGWCCGGWCWKGGCHCQVGCELSLWASECSGQVRPDLKIIISICSGCRWHLKKARDMLKLLLSNKLSRNGHFIFNLSTKVW